MNPKLIFRVRELWNLFRSAGSSNPLSALEQITYLIALKRLEVPGGAGEGAGRGEASLKASGKSPYPRWSELKRIKKLKSQQGKFAWFKDIAFPYLKRSKSFGNAFQSAMVDAVFGISHPKLLEEAVNIIDQLPVGDEDIDVQGDIYDELLSQLSFSGKHTQFPTPRHIIRTMVELCDPQMGEAICDPAAGTGGFLVTAYQWILKTHTSLGKVRVGPDGAWQNLTGDLLPLSDGEKGAIDNKDFVGYDFDNTMVRLGLMNMMLHGISQPEYYRQDALSSSPLRPRRFDLLMSYVPFGGTVERRSTNKKPLRLTTPTELFFVEKSLALLKAKGRCALIVPESVAINTDSQSHALRQQIIEKHKLEAVVSLPRGCFLPYTATKTAILLIKKEGVTDQVLFYEVSGDGFTLDDKRKPDPKNNDLSIVPQAYRAQVLGDEKAWPSKAVKDLAAQRSVVVKKKEINANGLSFAIGLYRQTRMVAEKHEDPQLIIKRVHAMQGQIQLKLKHIQAMIKEVVGA